ncbi:hypothetical protein QJS10_CPA03g00710 [Acorus calamus]|uniref:Uncharacterized protein n=1 Tax=Acorus calamus TaxID=4465 RepID=A0AAV9F831_ACOCL|nr:hypothetical protein QJS10_CPA03g00710 [Acorus calamus]
MAMEHRPMDMRPIIVPRPPPRVFHNFEMPPLKWGNHRLLRCVKFGPDGKALINVTDRSPLSKLPDEAVRDQEDSTREGNGNGVSGAQKLSKIHLRSPPLPPPTPLSRPPRPPAAAAAASVQLGRGEDEEEADPSPTPSIAGPDASVSTTPSADCRAAPVQYRSLRLRGIAAAAVTDLEGERAEKKRKSRSDEGSYFRLALSRADAEADILFLMGSEPSKPHKRQNKRPSWVQRELNVQDGSGD